MTNLWVPLVPHRMSEKEKGSPYQIPSQVGTKMSVKTKSCEGNKRLLPLSFQNLSC